MASNIINILCNTDQSHPTAQPRRAMIWSCPPTAAHTNDMSTVPCTYVSWAKPEATYVGRRARMEKTVTRKQKKQLGFWHSPISRVFILSTSDLRKNQCTPERAPLQRRSINPIPARATHRELADRGPSLFMFFKTACADISRVRSTADAMGECRRGPTVAYS